MKTCYVMVGLPGTGKSTYISKNREDNDIVLSQDDVIDRLCSSNGLTYSQGFDRFIGTAVWGFKNSLKNIDPNKNYWVDRTHMSSKSRREVVNSFPNHKKIAVVFVIDRREHQNRLKSREHTGKIIPQEVLDRMGSSYKTPTSSEGFDEVIFVGE